MKKWSLTVAGLYGLAVLVLGMPLGWIAFADMWGGLGDYIHDYLDDVVFDWYAWVVVAVMTLAQWALLRVPVAMASGRPVARRSIWSTVLASAFMMSLLVLTAVASIYETATRTPGIRLDVAVAIGLLSWGGWAFYFHRVTSRLPAPEQVKKLRKHLWSGSVLELLIAIPTHIVARHRDYCCAGFMTFLGLICGFAVMLFAFGPALYFLFVDRWKRVHGRTL